MDWFINFILNKGISPQSIIRFLKSTLLIVFGPVFIFIFIGYLWIENLYDSYDRYWGHKDRNPQGTIFAVQTVENNMAAHTYPVVIAELLKEQKVNEIEKYMYSIYKLGGFAVTSCSKGSTKFKCLDEKLVSYTKSWWLNQNNIWKSIKDSDFNILTDMHEPGIDWKYKAPKDHSIIDLKFEPKGEVIGKLYYVRNPRPEFFDQLYNWAIYDHFLSGSTDKKYYSLITSAYLGIFVVSLLLFYVIRNTLLSRFNFENEKASLLKEKIKQTEEFESNITLMKENQDILLEEINKHKSEISLLSKETEENILYQKELENDIKLAKSDTEKKKLQQRLNEYKNKENEAIRLQNIAIEELDELDKKYCQKTELLQLKTKECNQLLKTIEKLKLQKPLKNKSEKSILFEHFINGMNSHSPFEVEYHKDVTRVDLKKLDKSGYSINDIEKITLNSIVEYSKRNTISDVQKLKFLNNVYHNKRDSIRIYFSHERKNINRVFILSIMSADRAPHGDDRAGIKKLESRLSNGK